MNTPLKGIRNLLFDLGNVLIDIDFDLTFQAFATLSGLSEARVRERFSELQIWERYEKGELSDDGFRLILKKMLPAPCSDVALDEAWNALLLFFPLERLERLKALKSDYRLFLLSNTSAIHIKEVEQILKRQTGAAKLKFYFEKVYYSYEVGLRKPDRAIYEYVLQDAGIKAEETLFLDDNLDNILGAREVGLRAEHVREGRSMMEILADA